MRWSAATIEAGRREAAAFADPDTRRREKRIGETPLALANKEVQSAFDDLADIIANGREVGHRGLRRLGAHLAGALRDAALPASCKGGFPVAPRCGGSCAA
jgi:hypothetical protein